MKAIFAHDHKFIYSDGKYYSNGSFGLKVFERYTRVFKQLTVISRQVEVDKIDDSFTLSSNKNINFIKVPNLNSIRQVFLKKYTEQIIKKEIEDADYVIARLPSTIGSLAVKYARKLNKPYVIEVVGCSWDSYFNHGNRIGKLIAPFMSLKQKFDIKFSPNVIYITKFFLQSRYPTKGKAVVIPNVLIPPTDATILSNRICHIKNNTSLIKFGLVGSLDVDYKGHETLLRALSKIKGQLPSFHIEFLGNGDPARWIKLSKELNLSENIKFVGSLPSGEQVFNWMDTIDVAVQPSLAEAQGRSIIEFMSRGCPIIATEVGGIVELIDPDYLINSEDSTGLSEKILEILKEDNMLNQAKRNYIEAQEYYEPIIEKKRNIFFEKFRDENFN